MAPRSALRDVAGLDDQGGRRVALKPLETGQQFRQDVFLGGEIDADLAFLGVEFGDALFGRDDGALAHLDAIGDGDEAGRDRFGFAADRFDLSGNLCLAGFGIFDLALNRADFFGIFASSART